MEVGKIIKIKRLPDAATATKGIYITGPIWAATVITKVKYCDIFEDIVVYTDTLKLAKLY